MTEITGKSTTGTGGINQMSVDRSGRGVVRADTETDMNHAMGIGLGYIFHSTDDAGAGEETLYLQNNGFDIHLHKIIVSTAASGVVSVMHQTSGTAAGTELIGRNGILGRPKMPNVTAFGNASVTGTVDGVTLHSQDIGTSSPFVFDMEDLLIPDTEAVFVRIATAGIVHITLFCFREIA